MIGIFVFVEAVLATFAIRSSLNCSTKANDSYLQTVKVLYCFTLTYVAIEARGICTDYNYERNMCPGCALACFRLWLRHWH